MTVDTAHFALGDLTLDAVPVETAPGHRHDRCLLVAQVVEFQHDRVALAAVDAWMRLE
jgi:hypothetical protein